MTTSSPHARLRRILFWVPIVLCFGINSGIFCGVAIHHHKYLFDYELNKNPDAVQYVRQGRNTLLHGQFSRSLAPPYVPDMIRTPVYPVFAGALDLIGKPLAIYVVQRFSKWLPARSYIGSPRGTSVCGRPSSPVSFSPRT